MKITAVMIFRRAASTSGGGEVAAVKLADEYDLSSFSFFQRSSVKEVCTFVSRGVVTRCKPGERAIVQHEDMSVVRHAEQ